MPHGERWWGLAWLYEWLRRRDSEKPGPDERAVRRMRELERTRRFTKAETRTKERRARPDRPPRRKRTRRRP